MPKSWKIAPKVADDLVEQLLCNRGITTSEEKEKFFHPKLSDYQSDLKIPGIPKALNRIKKAIEEKELIVVFGDYDVDGICGAAILYLALTSLGAKVLPYIPHREKEGYGLSKAGLDYARDSGAKLVISVDCGIVAFEQAVYAKKTGLDLIITDHHQPLETKPEALVIVHTASMCGAAVAWCLVRQMLDEGGTLDLLDLVAIATVGDMIPLTGVNRCFVSLGLEKLKKTKRVGLLALCLQGGIKPSEISTFHLGYIIGPRLNALGRIEHALDVLRLLCTKDPAKASKLAKILCDANDQRKKLTLEAVLQAKEMVSISKVAKEEKIIIVQGESWIPGIIGLVAGRLAEEFGVASIAIAQGETFSKGSARSANGLNIVETIRACKDLLVDVGGHEGAAGFTIETNKLAEFKVKLQEVIKGKQKTLEPVLKVDAEVLVKKLSKKLVGEVAKFEPFGVGNPQPILATFGMRLGNIRTVGEGKHLKFSADGIDAIAFGRGSSAPLLQNGQLADLAYNLEIDDFNGGEKVQLKVKDFKPSV